MKLPPYNHAAFTLPEVLVVTALSGLVLAILLTLLVASSGICRDGIARMQLSIDSRVTRERILHGLDGRFGLRHASRAHLSYTSNQISFSDISSSNAFILLLKTNLPAVYMDASGQHRLTQSLTFVDQASIVTNGYILNIDLTLAMTNAWKKFTQPQQIRVYLLNE